MRRQPLWALIIFSILATISADTASADLVLFTSDIGEPGNMDIYSVDLDSGVLRRLTTDPGIDNHPNRSHDGTKVVWSSTRLKEKPSDGGMSNPEGDFEIFIADWSDTEMLDAPGGSVSQLSSNDVTDLHIPGDMRNIPDRHPHFTPDGLRIIYTSKYVCVTIIEVGQVCFTQCSQPRCVTTTEIIPCGRLCEAMRIMDIADLNGDKVGDNLIDIDHDALSAVDPLIWPPRADTDSRWIGHPSFNEDGDEIIFSGAVDGEGRAWEVYVMDWDGIAPTGLRQVTDGSSYPPNANPIRMTGGAIFAAEGDSILFTSTRTLMGNSQLFILPASASMEPVSVDNRYWAMNDLANVYVPHHLEDGRFVAVSDLDPFNSMKSCCGGDPNLTIFLDPGLEHQVRLEATGLAGAGSGTMIHLDAYSLNGALKEDDDLGITYTPDPWDLSSSPNASGGFYTHVPGDAFEIADIDVPPGTSTVELFLGKTPESGVVQIFVDDVPITNGNFALPGDAGGDMSGVDLFTPEFSTSNDLDLIILDPEFGTVDNLTDNDMADEMLLIGDEVSWFCGLSPNVSPCTYLPKTISIESLRLETGMHPEHMLPENFPNYCLYPIHWQALNDYMMQPNPLRPQNQNIWNQVQAMLLVGQDQQQVVLPTPVNFCIDNLPPDQPTGLTAIVGDPDFEGMRAVTLVWDPLTDPDPDILTADVYLSAGGGPMLLAGKDLLGPTSIDLVLPDGDNIKWSVDAKDCMGGHSMSATEHFIVTEADDNAPAAFGLAQNVPNPFNPKTKISFAIPDTGSAEVDTELKIYTLSGRSLRSLIHEALAPGTHEVSWDGRDDHGRRVSSGVYFYRIVAGDFVSAKKMLMIK